MAVRLLDADHHVIAHAVQVLGLLDRQIDGIVLVVSMPDHATFVVDNIPAIQRFVVVDMNGVVRTGFGGGFGHLQRPRRALPTFSRLLPTFLTALRTLEAFFLVFLAS